MSEQEKNSGSVSDSQEDTRRVIENIGMLDLRSAKDIESLKNVTAIRNVGAIIIPEELAGMLAGIPMQNVGSVIPIPQGTNVSLQMGQVRLSGEALAAGPEDTILVLVGQVFVTSQVEKVGYKEMRLTGQLFAPRGSEGALGAKMTQMTGQVMYYPLTDPSQDLRVLIGDESIGREFLELLEHPTVLVAVGDITFKEDITPDLLKTKVPAMMLVGDALVPRHLLPLVQALTAEKVGDITAYPKGARFFSGEDTLIGGYFESMAEPVALMISGDVIIAEDVTPELLKSKVREITLTGQLYVPRPLLSLVQTLAVEKTGRIIAYPSGSRLCFFRGKDTLGREYFEFLPEPVAMIISGKVTLLEDVTPELIRDKVREIVLTGKLTAPKALTSLLRALMTEKTGKLQSLEEAQSEE